MTKTTCFHCGTEIESTSTRGRPKRFCSDSCKQAAYRLRRTQPTSLEAVTRSQRRDDRRSDFQLQRPQQLAGRTTTELPEDLGRLVVELHDGWYSLSGGVDDPVQDEALWRLCDESADERWSRLSAEAVDEWLRLRELIDTVRHTSTTTAYVSWLLRWKYHPELTESEGRFVVEQIPALTLEWFKKE